MTAIRTGLIGLGNSGYFYHCRAHLEASDQFDLVAVAAAEREWVEEVAHRTGATPYVDWRALVEDERVELVVIATPHSLHKEMARHAIETGKHAHLEKPMTTTAADADELIAAARRADVVLSVHQQRRFEHDFMVLRQLVEGGAIGEVWKVDVARSHAGKYRAMAADRPHQGDRVLDWPHERAFGGGISWLVGPHPVDQLLELVGSPTTQVVGYTHQAAGDEVEDYINLEVSFASGVLGRVEVFRSAGITPTRFRVQGTGGSIVARGGTKLEVSSRGHAPFTVSGLTAPSVLGDEIYEGLYRAIREGGPLAVAAEEARDAVELIELALKSAAKGGVALPTSPLAPQRRHVGTR